MRGIYSKPKARSQSIESSRTPVPRSGRPGRDLREQLVLHNFLRTQGIAVVHQINLAGDIGQVQRLFHRRIAGAEHHDTLIFVESAVTHGAGRYAASNEIHFRRTSEVPCGGTDGDEQHVAGVFPFVAVQAKRAPRQLGLLDMVVHHFRVEALRMRDISS